ncbi:MAG: DUF349 domain-containing protein [Prolixibacteraceae bacterium]|nr:DUF349 domain-containing protein [Prolixibacteraceae bacterium]
MEPKDLKNSEELKSTKKTDLENSEKNVLPSEKETNKPIPAEDEKVMPETSLNSEEKTDSEEQTFAEAENVKATEEESAPEEEGKMEPVAEKAEKEVVETHEVVSEEPATIDEPAEQQEKSGETADNEAGQKEAQTKETETEKEEKPVVKTPQPEAKKEKPDYTKYTQVELVNAMRDILESNSSRDVKEEIDLIKSTFYRNLKANVEEQKTKFLEEGGNIEEFVAEKDPYEQDIKDLLKRFRQIRIEFNKKLEVEKEENLKLKYQVIEEIKALINNEESINKTFQEFRDLQRRWREIGLVPQSEMKNLWDTYHFHVENFYDYIKINKELRDLDLKKNLEAKIKLCERAEELLVEPSIIKAFNTLQKYHEQWREIGPVPIEQKDDIWERFKAATAKINKKHQEFFDSRKLEQKKNLEAKIALCEKVEEINQQEITSHREWDEKSKEMVELQKVWRTIGFAPRKDNNRIYERFRNECDKFFDAKREFYSKNKELQQNNLQLKLELCNEAETMKDSTDWKKTTQDFINIQKRWKEIGPVPRKHSDALWKRFRSACDYFFDKKSEHFSGLDTEQVDNLKLKNDLIKEVENFKPLKDVDENLKMLKSFQRRWTEIGHVPIKKKDDVQNRFRDAINQLFDELNLDEEKRNLLKFKSKMTSYTASPRGQNKMRMERDKYMNKLKQLENDLVLLDNNIGFFTMSKNAESLIQDVKKKIENTKQKIEFLKEKIRVIDDLDTVE